MLQKGKEDLLKFNRLQVLNNTQNEIEENANQDLLSVVYNPTFDNSYNFDDQSGHVETPMVSKKSRSKVKDILNSMIMRQASHVSK